MNDNKIGKGDWFKCSSDSGSTLNMEAGRAYQCTKTEEGEDES